MLTGELELPFGEAPPYGDLTRLNRDGLIKRSVDRSTLWNIVSDFLVLLGTSSAVYERNGDYACGIFASRWCRSLDEASFRLCATRDPAEALSSGKWICHECCWTKCAKLCIEKGGPVDTPCDGGLRLYAVPIHARGEVVGAINVGYGTPPQSEEMLGRIASTFEMPLSALRAEAEAYPPRPPFIIELAKTRLRNAAALIGSLVEAHLDREALQESERRFRMMIERSPVGVGMVDQSAEVVECNSALAEMVGYAREDLIGMNFADFTHPDDLETEWGLVQDLWGRKATAYRMEKRYVHRDGRSVPVEISASVFWDEEGETPFVFAFVQDTTERKQSEARLRQLEKASALGQLAAGVAHNFNNQLAGIMGHIELLERHLSDPKLKHHAECVLGAAWRSAELTQQLLTFGRKEELQQGPIYLNESVGQVVSILEQTIDRRIAIRQRLTAERDLVCGAPRQIQNAILNVGLNARDAMPEGGELVFQTHIVELDATFCGSFPYEIRPGRFICVSVSDTGCGMDAETKNRLFEPFFTTKPVNKGTGMGLAAVYGTVEYHGGAVEVESAPEKGTVVRLYFPQACARSNEGRGQPAKTEAPRRILLVDDEAVFREMAKEMLTEVGHRVETAENGKAAVEWYVEHWQEVDLVILDMVMPKMDGAEAFREMRRINPQAAILIASGYAMEGRGRQLLAEGAKGFLQKPFTREALDKAIAESAGVR
jgi:PAS domain S-box-containing protein